MPPPFQQRGKPPFLTCSTSQLVILVVINFSKETCRMQKRRVVCAAALLLVLPLLAAAQPPPVDITFTVAMSRPHTHLFDIDIAIKRAANGPQEELLVMPVWTPGSYLVREFERHVQDFAAADAAGRPLK